MSKRVEEKQTVGDFKVGDFVKILDFETSGIRKIWETKPDLMSSSYDGMEGAIVAFREWYGDDYAIVYAPEKITVWHKHPTTPVPLMQLEKTERTDFKNMEWTPSGKIQEKMWEKDTSIIPKGAYCFNNVCKCPYLFVSHNYCYFLERDINVGEGKDQETRDILKECKENNQ